MIISSPSNSFRAQQVPITAAEKALIQSTNTKSTFQGAMNAAAATTTTTAAAAVTPSTTQAVSLGSSIAKTPEQEFLDFLKEPPQQQMEDLWLKQHHLTREQLAAMKPEDRQKIMDQMKQDIERQIKEAINKKLSKGVNIVA